MSKAIQYFEDAQVGQCFGGEHTYAMTEQNIFDFAREFDPQPFHLDAEAAKKSVFGELVASGWHTASATMRLLVKTVPVAGGLVGLGGEAAWPRATKPGDVLHIEGEVIALKPSRTGERGVVTVRVETKNQRDETVQILTAKLLVPTRGAS